MAIGGALVMDYHIFRVFLCVILTCSFVFVMHAGTNNTHPFLTSSSHDSRIDDSFYVITADQSVSVDRLQLAVTKASLITELDQI